MSLRRLRSVLVPHGVTIELTDGRPEGAQCPFSDHLAIHGSTVRVRRGVTGDDVLAGIIHEAGHIVHGFARDEGTWHWWELWTALEAGMSVRAWLETQWDYNCSCLLEEDGSLTENELGYVTDDERRDYALRLLDECERYVRGRGWIWVKARAELRGTR
jgi:hypothetical protein